MKLNVAPQSLWENPIHFLAFGCGSGAIPFAPGTWGTLAIVPFYLLIRDFPLWCYASIVLIFCGLGIWLCEIAAKDCGVHDHPGIVWDEFSGFLITMIAAPADLSWIVLGFLLFRLFDVLKPQPIQWLNDHISGGLGIMLDDILAGIAAWTILQIISWVI